MAQDIIILILKTKEKLIKSKQGNAKYEINTNTFLTCKKLN